MAKRIVVDLWREVLTAYDGDTTTYTFDCVSGDLNHPTEEVEEQVPGIGTVCSISGDWVKHKILSKVRHAVSAKYGNVPMPYAMFFTADGKAIHSGVAVGLLSFLQWANVGSVGSHGCVRLDSDDGHSYTRGRPSAPK
jgi:L,D-transpeptidase catalytic domain